MFWLVDTSWPMPAMRFFPGVLFWKILNKKALSEVDRYCACINVDKYIVYIGLEKGKTSPKTSFFLCILKIQKLGEWRSMALVVNMYQKDPFQHNLDIIVFFFFTKEKDVYFQSNSVLALLQNGRYSFTHTSQGIKYTQCKPRMEIHKYNYNERGTHKYIYANGKLNNF